MTILAKLPSSSDHPRPHRRRLRSLAFVPTLITLGNLLCGFAAIHFGLRAMYDLGAGITSEQMVTLQRPALERILPSFLSVGASLVILGMILDCFDGLIARVTRVTTNFGGQLDSLADVVTFGVAPATLMVAFMTKELAGDSIVPSPISEHALGRLTWVSAAVYVAFTAVRLARFNVEHAKADFDYRIFRGLPSPGAASILVALILFQDQPMGAAVRGAIVYATPLIAMTIAFLMVSRIPYRRFHRAYLLGRQPFGQFLFVMLLLAIFLAFKAETLLLIALWYGLSGPLFHVVRLIRERSRPRVATGGRRADDEEERRLA
ncbi:MAG: CDP-alcohol phosphatidyltransferase family protein [Planctomycetota bacterium]